MRFGPDIESIVSKQLNAGSVVSNWSVEMSHFGKWIAGLVAAAGLAGLVAPVPAMAQAVNPGDSAGYPPAPYGDPYGRTNDLSSIYAAANYPPPQRMPGAPPPPKMQPPPPPLIPQSRNPAPVNPQQAYANSAPVYRQPVYQPSAYPAARPIMATQAPPTRTNGYATPSFGSAPSLAAPSYSAQPAPAYAGQAAPRQVMAQGWTAPPPSYPLPRQTYAQPTYAQPAYAQPGYGQGYAPAAAGPNLSQVYRYAQPSPYMQVAYAQPVAQPTYLPAPAYAAQPGCGCGPSYVAAPPVRVAESYDVGGSRVSRQAMPAPVAPQSNHNATATHTGSASVHHAHKPRAQGTKGQDCGCGAA